MRQKHFTKFDENSDDPDIDLKALSLFSTLDKNANPCP